MGEQKIFSGFSARVDSRLDACCPQPVRQKRKPGHRKHRHANRRRWPLQITRSPATAAAAVAVTLNLPTANSVLRFAPRGASPMDLRSRPTRSPKNRRTSKPKTPPGGGPAPLLPRCRRRQSRRRRQKRQSRGQGSRGESVRPTSRNLTSKSKPGSGESKTQGRCRCHPNTYVPFRADEIFVCPLFSITRTSLSRVRRDHLCVRGHRRGNSRDTIQFSPAGF